jgi:hypothetical protein
VQVKTSELTGAALDWEVVCIDSESYAIYRKGYNEEWQDAQGDNLVFNTDEEATQYLRNTFNEKGKGHEGKNI